MTRLIFLLIALIALGGPSQAQSNDASKKCDAELETNNFDLSIDYCTAAIQSGDLSDQDLAILFNNRGLVYANKKDYDRAIEDYDQAMRLGLNDSNVYYRRGLVYFEK